MDIDMPREAARIFLLVTCIRVERLQDCGNMQAKDEGCVSCSQFARVWDSTIKPADLHLYPYSYLDHDGDEHFCSWGQRKEAEHDKHQSDPL